MSCWRSRATTSNTGLRGAICLQVVQVKTVEKEGYDALQLGCGAKRAKQVIDTNT